MFWLGVAAFALFFLGDFNDRFSIGKPLMVCFPIGCIFLLISAICQIIFSTSRAPFGGLIAAAVLAGIFFLLMLMSLFGSFSNEEGYGNPGEKRRVYTKKMYAICRHPGVVWFILMAICLVFTGLPPIAAAVYSVLNVLLALFEDLVVFPYVLSGYEEYKKTTHFLLPGIKGIRKCINDYRGRA